MEHVSIDGRLTGLPVFPSSSLLAEEDLVPSTSSSVVNLLLQALESCDQSLLDWCLERTVEKAIPASIASLPTARAEQLLLELGNRFLTFHQSAGVVLAWLQPLLSIHRSALSPESVQSMVQKLQIRTEKFRQLASIRAKLHFLTEPGDTKEGVKIIADRAVTYTEDSADQDMQ